jgi:hypothetical protein
MNGRILTTAVIAAVVPLVLTWLLRSRTAATVRADGTIVLSYPRLWRGLVSFFALVPPAIAVLALVSPPKPDEAWIPGAIALGFAALIAPLGWEVFRFRLEAGPNSIVCFSPWRGRLELAWSDATVMTFNPSTMLYVVRGRTGGTIRVPHYASGIEEFKTMVAERGVGVTEIPTRG